MTISSSICKSDCLCANHTNKFKNVKVKTCMHIRHSYSIGSIGLFPSSIYKPPLQNEDSSKYTHILYTWPTFPDLQCNLVNPTEDENIQHTEVSNKILKLCASERAAACRSLALLSSLCRRPANIRPHYTFLQRQKPRWIYSDSFTNIKYTNSCKDSATCLLLSIKKVKYRPQASAVFLGDFQGT